MVQVKKEEVRQAILASAFRKFSAKGYAGTNLSEIAKDAGTSTSNIYVYFGGKLEILQEIFRPWLLLKIDELEIELQSVEDPRRRLTRIFTALWDEIPAADGAFALNLMQGLILATPGEKYSRSLLHYLESRVTKMIAEALPPERRGLLDENAFAHLVFKAFDGFIADRRIHGRSKRMEIVIDLAVRLILGDGPAPAQPQTR